MKTISYIFTFAVAVLSTAVPSCLSADQQYEECLAPLRCGSGPTMSPNITYPFWGVNKPNFCGQTEFQLSCKNNQNLTLDLVNLSLQIMSFDLENQTLTVVDDSLFDGGCPNRSVNFTGSNQFTIAPTVDKIDLLICPTALRLDIPLSSFTCRTTTNEVNETYYVFGSSDTVVSVCSKSGEVPVLKSVKDDLEQSRITLKEALVKGFDLRYTNRETESCSRCLSSGGICGSDSVSGSFRCLCSDKPYDSTCNHGGANVLNPKRRGNVGIKITIGVVAGAAGIILLITALMFHKLRPCCVRDQNLDALIPLKRYSYAQVKKITKSFKHQVGKGGFGIVYCGNLCDGRKVAVKVLKDSKGKGEDFINEVASISRTSHVNIVTLLGFCYENSKRAIIYEFLENGSLDKFISNKNWSALYGIALGVARGIEYLHNGCTSRIVHFDIKPQNVLLDDNLCPKVSDFGLAKLCKNKESILSSIETRGTIGYIAPEVFSRMYGRVSHKSDVYSYGMLILEMIGVRNKTSTEDSASNTSSMYFPEWIYKDLEKGDIGSLNESGINNEEEEIAKKMTLVGLWCIQSSPSNRPAMDEVVEMLEGSLDALQIPPKPVLQHAPAATLLESSWISEEDSSPSLLMM